MGAGGIYQAAILLNSGILVVAGRRSSADVLSSAELYDPDTGAWSTTGALTYTRDWHTATLLPNGKVLVAGGGGNNGLLTTAELYGPDTGKWTVTGALSTARYWHTATLLPDGKLLLAGGEITYSSILSS